MESGSIEITQGSDRNFGIVIGSVLALVFAYFSWKSGTIIWWGFGICLALVAIALIRPAWLRIPNYLWFRFGILLGRIIAPIVLAIVYVTTVVPTGLIMKLAKKDILHLKLDDDAGSYWIERESQPQTMKNQF